MEAKTESNPSQVLRSSVSDYVHVIIVGAVFVFGLTILVVYQANLTTSEISLTTHELLKGEREINHNENIALKIKSSSVGSLNKTKVYCNCEQYCKIHGGDVSEVVNGSEIKLNEHNLITEETNIGPNTSTISTDIIENKKSENKTSLTFDEINANKIERLRSYLKEIKGYSKHSSEVKNVFVLTTWRSGSSFFGEALSSHPAIFYHFEPLMYFDYQEINSGKALTEALWTLRNLSDCNYTAVSKYMNTNRVTWNLLSLNNKISDQCEASHDSCFNSSFLQQTCQLYPVQLFKVTRLRGAASEELLKQFKNVKIIYLVRDPRAIYSSRMHVGWCPPTSPCGKINLLCESLKEDLMEIRKLQWKYPDKIQVIKYEHIATKPTLNFKNILFKLGIPWHKSVQEYLKIHTSGENTNDPMSTVKVSKLHVNKWEKSLAKETILSIETHCHEFMLDLNYDFMHK